MANEPEVAVPLRYIPFNAALVRSDDHLYFIRSADGFCKIGRSLDPANRFIALNVATPHALTMIAVMENMGWQERVWHKAFGVHHHAGEWFRWCDEIETAINAAADGEEWIATLSSTLPGDEFWWRDKVADLEERAASKHDAKVGA